MRIPEKEKEKGMESILKAIMAENFLNLVKDMNLLIPELINHHRKNQKKSTPKHIIIC